MAGSLAQNDSILPLSWRWLLTCAVMAQENFAWHAILLVPPLLQPSHVMSVRVSSRCISVTANSNCSSRLQSEMLRCASVYLSRSTKPSQEGEKCSHPCRLQCTGDSFPFNLEGSGMCVGGQFSVEYMEEMLALLNTSWENAGSCFWAFTTLSAAAFVLILWLAALVQQRELPTLNDRGR